MKVTNNFKSHNTTFNAASGNNSNASQNLNKMEFLMGRLCEVLTERTENEVPENGKFAPISVSIPIPETSNKAKAIVEYDALEPKNTRRLSIASHHANSDRLVTTYVAKGTKQDIIDYLKNHENQERLVKLANELSEYVDGHYGNL